MDIQPQPTQPQNTNLNSPVLTPRGFGGLGMASANSTSGRVVQIVFIISLLAGSLAAIVYGVVFLWQRSLNVKSDNLSKQIQQIESQPVIDKALAKDIKATNEAVGILKNLLSRHIVSESLFRLVEDHTLTKVCWSDLTFRAPQLFNLTGTAGGGLASLTLSGSTQTYLMVGRQLRALENLPEIKSVKLNQFSESESGVNFGLSIDLSPDNFFYKLNY
ncbi:MAG: hypothetical protein COU83_01485 [Candidatus Portnoybacteria bacterium CG10_big_fil_rev_8_21_14_0_10_40_22]|uniref:PilN domain-containing protein n=1 Tax=Candidatus Portnoybacteria bacterium CG10_big_fil_rev_8_21_14_0_10_40_22 TaxID=1974814 RepID=A0A2M8KG38_9BACT|nr:MAG: hypothetical protein COU83_01485 [Candidatus Portnoybacteria bacterium CG10_big_fil_rev_8_21_14_0_10_40_22]